MYLGTFSRRARSLATIPIFTRVRILGTQCLFVIATVTKVSRKRGLWLVVRVNKKPQPYRSSLHSNGFQFYFA